MILRHYLLLATCGVLSACYSPGALEVRPFHLREVSLKGADEPFIDAEEKRRMFGAVGVREQEQRLGMYYTILWKDDQVNAPARVVFRYQQAATGSRVLEKVQDFSAATREGKAEFTIIGDDYLKGGRVLAWKCTLERGGQVIASRHSYLWE